MNNFLFSVLISFIFVYGFVVGGKVNADGDILQFRGVFGPQNYNIIDNVYYTSRIGLLTAWGDAGGVLESNLRCFSSDYETEDDTSGQLDISIYSTARDRFLCKFIPSNNIKLGDIGIGSYNLVVWDNTDQSNSTNFNIHYDSNNEYLLAIHEYVVLNSDTGYDFTIDKFEVGDVSLVPFTPEHILFHSPLLYIGWFVINFNDVCPADRVDYTDFSLSPLVYDDLSVGDVRVCWFVEDSALNYIINYSDLEILDTTPSDSSNNDLIIDNTDSSHITNEYLSAFIHFLYVISFIFGIRVGRRIFGSKRNGSI